jgi:transcriptional repressor NrdR
MRCPFCSEPDTQVLETRDGTDGTVVRRRRRCPACGRRFTTFERAEIKLPTVIKRNGLREPYQREKLRASMELALRKRPVSGEQIQEAIDAIEARLLSSAATEISSAQIGEWAMEALKNLDKIAYIRFASVYRNFADVDAFSQFLHQQIKPPRRSRRLAGTPAESSPPADLFSAVESPPTES